MEFPYVKALHIIFITTWFAGLFYIVRLFIYQTEALEEEEPARTILTDKLAIMAKRLWLIITWPSAIITLVFGLWSLYLQPVHLQFMYMWVKLGLVVLLYVYHILCHTIYRDLQNKIVKVSSIKLRFWNEIATVLLIAIVFLIVVRTSMSLLWGFGGLLGLMIVFSIIIRVYKNRRQKSEN